MLHFIHNVSTLRQQQNTAPTPVPTAPLLLPSIPANQSSRHHQHPLRPTFQRPSTPRTNKTSEDPTPFHSPSSLHARLPHRLHSALLPQRGHHLLHQAPIHHPRSHASFRPRPPISDSRGSPAQGQNPDHAHTCLDTNQPVHRPSPNSDDHEQPLCQHDSRTPCKSRPTAACTRCVQDRISQDWDLGWGLDRN